MLRQRIEQLLALPLETLDRAALQQALRDIGKVESA
jgi:arsenate reductase